MHLQCNCKEKDKYNLRDTFAFKKASGGFIDHRVQFCTGLNP